MTLIVFVLLIADPILYIICRKKFGLKEATGWKRLIPFCWVFA